MLQDFEKYLLAVMLVVAFYIFAGSWGSKPKLPTPTRLFHLEELFDPHRLLGPPAYSGPKTPFYTETQSFHFVLYCSEKWNAEGLRSDGNTSNRTVPFQKIERLKK